MWFLLSIIFSRCPAIFNGICTSWLKKKILLAIRILRESSKFLELQFISSFHPISKMDSIFDDVSWCHIFWPRNHCFFLLLLSRITLKLCPKQRSAHVPYLTPWPQRFDYAMTEPSLTQRCPGQRWGKAKWVCKFCQIWIKSTFGMNVLKQFAEQEKNRDTVHCKVCTVHYKYI